MNHLLKQYLDGKYSEVWNLINQEDLESLKMSYGSQIDEIFNEAFTRIQYNTNIVFQILDSYNYKYKNFGQRNKYDLHYVPADKETAGLLANFENKIKNEGFLPRSITEFYKKFKVLDFRGSFQNLDYDFLTDALYIIPIHAFVGLNDDLFSWETDKVDVPYVLFSPDEYVKEDISGDIGYGLPVSQQRKADDFLINYKRQSTFLDYLRFCFEWACLPNLAFKEKEQIPEDIKALINQVRQEIRQF